MANPTRLARQKADQKANSLENIVDARPKTSRVYVLSEVGYDTDYFNPGAYENLLRMMSEDKDISGILVDGAVTRLDRPEFLNEALTYWDKSESECKEAGERILNRNQYRTMMEIQLGIVEERLKELKDRIPQAKKIVLSLHSEDVHYTASAMLNEMLIRGQLKIGESIEKLKTKKGNLKQTRKGYQKELDQFAKLDKLNRRQEKKQARMEKNIDTTSTKIDDIESKLKDLYEEQRLYREKKVRPAHQFFTKQFLSDFYRQYKTLCDSVGVELVTEHSVLDFDGMLIDYAHSRHSTWNPIKARDKQLAKSVHGKLKRLKGIDVILESGHFGIGYKQLQKLKDSPEETNFKNQSSYVSGTCDDHITIVMALPFEDHAAICEYAKGKKAIRMSGGKPMNTRKIAATDRYNNDGVTGLTILTKDEEGVVGTEWVQYQNFVDGSVLNQPEEYSIICASADEHLRSPESNPIVTDGWVGLYRRLLAEPVPFRGRKAFARGLLNAGDVGEANSRKWDHRYHRKRSPEELMQENIELLARFSPKSEEDVIALAMKMTNDAMGGSVESMSDILESVADYLDSFLEGSLEHSRMKWLVAATTGNHADNVLRDLGLRESDFFKQRLKARGVGFYEVGTPDYYRKDPAKDARVFLGGYSNARILNIPDYGLDTEGRPMFGPINLVVQHDPKGSGMNGVIGAGKNADADLSLAGHTHENKLRLYKTDENTFSVAYRLATLQGVSPTEKYYSYSVPRTQAAHQLVMPMPGDFSEKAIPAGYLREKGLESVRGKVKKEMKKSRRSKKR